ncbi:hypothetical protein BRADI_2g25142v3 [Brachypodium distachyon]|uniref:Uncharacterized protein n=1 Tax=Brachypodium distachyon TaxID=15368 RepID=A0A2K2DAD2_BRADI|nr:hypothetical protein BRADI_2g25142v3 [Brachypodium distachyon]
MIIDLEFLIRWQQQHFDLWRIRSAVAPLCDCRRISRRPSRSNSEGCSQAPFVGSAPPNHQILLTRTHGEPCPTNRREEARVASSASSDSDGTPPRCKMRPGGEQGAAGPAPSNPSVVLTVCAY